MKLLAVLPNDDLAAAPQRALALEAAGYDGITSLENRHDPFLPLALAAPATSRVQLRTGVAIAFPRSPMVTANTAWDLQALSGGRFELGLGPQVRGHNERRFSVPWSAPAPRMREYVQALRAIWRCWAEGEPLAFEGDHYTFTLMTPNFTPERQATPPPPISIGAVGPAMLKLAGEVADGVQLHGFCTRAYLEQQVLPELSAGCARVDRSLDALAISCGAFVCTGPDDATVAAAIDAARVRVGFYGSTRAYWPVFEQHDLLDLGHELNHLSKTDGWSRMPGLVSDEVVRLFAAVGTHDEIPGVLDARFGGLIHAIGLAPLPGIDLDLPPDLIQDIQAIPTKAEPGRDRS
ncbi:MAG: TIGR03617 family F420-dependent LLM class oxidoreductase [Actinomycetota bacterium]